ncbi:MAG: MerR family transcriptional regulator [Anaerolineae bacterium]|nr:MerR family transcriptional regulator [Anaerolineae bacterium]
MHISELAKLSGLSVDTLRFYEKQGLLSEHHFERQPNNYRSYTSTALSRLELIKCAKLLGFTLSEIKTLIHDVETDEMTTTQQADVLSQKLVEIDQRLAEMTRLKTFIGRKLQLLRSGSQEGCVLPSLASDQPA